MSTYYVSIDKLPLADAVTLFFTNPVSMLMQTVRYLDAGSTLTALM
jgi:threonine/homoserine efflux transporter RhtA